MSPFTIRHQKNKNLFFRKLEFNNLWFDHTRVLKHVVITLMSRHSFYQSFNKRHIKGRLWFVFDQPFKTLYLRLSMQIFSSSFHGQLHG